MTDPARFERFQAMRLALKEELKWRSAGPVRDAVALSVLDMKGAPETIAQSLKAPAETLKQNHAKLQLLKQPIRYAIAAVLLQSGEDPLHFAHRMLTARERWKAAGLRRGSPYEGAALLIIHLGQNGTADPAFLASLKQAFDQLNSSNYWQVGTQTIPPLALALQYRSDAASAASQTWAAMKAEKRFHNRQTMEAALIATLANLSPEEAAARVAGLRTALKDHKVPDAPTQMGGLALASLTDPDAGAFAADVQDIRQRLKQQRVGSANAALLALDYVTAERIAQSDIPQAELAPLLMAIQAYQLVLQQQAAVAAAVGGAAAAGAAGAS